MDIVLKTATSRYTKQIILGESKRSKKKKKKKKQSKGRKL